MSRDESRRSKRCRADRDFDMGPATGIMLNDYDDERTLDEEEALEGSEDTHNELSHLQKESDMPLKELLVMYNYGSMSCQDANKDDDDEDEEEEEEEEEDDDDEDDDDATNYDEPNLKQFYTKMVKGDEDNANLKRPLISKTSDLSRRSDTLSLPTSINIHALTGIIDSKIEDNIKAASNILSNSQNASGPVDILCGMENVNSNLEAPSGGNSGGGGGGGSSRLLRSVSRPQSEEEDDDCDYSPDEEEWKKTIMVGSDYQAPIPEGLCKYDDALPYENEDKMLWDPCHINEEEVEEFLDRAQLPVVKGTSLPSGSQVKDDEQALYLLLQCGYNLEEALRRRRMNVLPSTESVSLWSEEECHNFETGLRNYGKDFHLIQKNKVRTRSVGELVQFYYLWKKTERHDIFTYKARLEKKKYALHPGITDYMDRFLEEQEGVRDRSSSPNIHCLLYGDTKRQRTSTNLTNNDESMGGKTAVDGWDGTNLTSSSNAATITTSGTTMTSSGITDEHSAPVNSGPADSLSVDHHHHRHNASSPVTGQLDYAKVIRSAGAESSVSSSAATPWPSTTTTLTASSSSSSSSSTSAPSISMNAAALTQQQQRNHLHIHHLQQQQQAPNINNHQHLIGVPPNVSSASLTAGNNSSEEAAIATARSPENILPHLPP